MGRVLKEAALVFALSRFVILLVSLLTVRFLPIYPVFASPHAIMQGCTTSLNCLRDAWWRWDVVYYVNIAHDGYNISQHTVFFPLLPLLMHGLAALAGSSEWADYGAGLLIANACFYGTLVLFYQLIARQYDRAVAHRALLLLAFAPYGIFFFAGYTESLFLLLCLATFLLLERGEARDWWLAGLCGCLATLTRPTGVLLLVPFLVFFVQRFGIRSLLTQERWRQKMSAILSMALIPAGLLLYLLYLWSKFGNPLIFQNEEARGWHRYSTFPWVGTFHVLHTFFVADRSIILLNLRDLAFTYLPLIALIIGWKRLPLHYSLFSLCMMLFLLANPLGADEALASAPRYMLVIFPVFLLFALWSKLRLVAALLAITWLTAYIAITVVFVSGYWIA